MNASMLRVLFLDYFATQQHVVVPSASLIPEADPSLLFTNAGMVPFKQVFLGTAHRPYTRAASAQRCIRAGGKHNDLENVGYTARHHTFFEMLGNFSFGDYFKREAITYAWRFLTEQLRLPSEKLWVTVFEDDDEAAAIWLNELKIDPARFSRCSEKDNFWSMGDTGPCGPCSEIFYDHGPHVAGGPPGSPDAEGDRYVEIWNLVFMQYQRTAEGELLALPKPSIDTGMGLERLAAVMQGVTNNYDTDLFQPLIQAAAKEAGLSDTQHTSLRVIADHIRSATFLVFDGVLPGNEGRAYVLRRIIRRALRHGHKLGLDRPFFYRLVKVLAEQMQAPYPDLIKKQGFIEHILRREEQQFAKTLTQGMKLLEAELIQAAEEKQLSGSVLFHLYDTYGFPVDLTADVARERGFQIDRAGFESEMRTQRNKSKAASQFTVLDSMPTFTQTAPTEFTGYDTLTDKQLPIIHLFKDSAPVTQLTMGESGQIVLNKTPFYAESGGQVGDVGQLLGPSGVFSVEKTVKKGDVIFHCGRVTKGQLNSSDSIHAHVDPVSRQAVRANHSATHLLHAALRQILGDHVQQKGSLVEASRLRFDFSHTQPLSAENLRQIEMTVNQAIRANYCVQTTIMTAEEAQKTGAIAIFGEKYGEKVRVLTMGDFSKELCGGTHVQQTGDIGLFKITEEAGVAAGVRRIQAVTGQAALDWVMALQDQLQQLATLFKAAPEKLLEKARNELTLKHNLQKRMDELQHSIVTMMRDELISQAIEIKGVQVLVSEIHGINASGLRELLDQLKNKLSHAVIVLASVDQGRIQLLVGVSRELTTKMKANELAKALAQSLGGQGGGRPDFAQAGCMGVEGLDEALKNAKQWVETQLNRNYA